MTVSRWILATAGFVLASAVPAPAHAQAACSEGWVQVGGQCRLPDDLVPGDEIQITIGSAVNARARIVAVADCEGQRTYYTSPDQNGCGWRNTITAFSRSSGDVSEQAASENALQAP